MTPPPPHILCGGGGGEERGTVLPPPTWKRPSAGHTHKSPLPVHGLSVRSHTYKAAFERASSPTPPPPPPPPPPCEQLSRQVYRQATVWRNFQSVPPQRKRILTLAAAQHQHPVSSTGNPIQRGPLGSAEGKRLVGGPQMGRLRVWVPLIPLSKLAPAKHSEGFFRKAGGGVGWTQRSREGDQLWSQPRGDCVNVQIQDFTHRLFL